MNNLKIIFGNAGQFGDVVMNTVVARALKEKFPNCQAIMSLSQKYKEIAPLFKNHPNINSVVIWETYDNWPAQKDIELIANIKPDIVLNPMPQHPNSHCWYNLVNHQTEASCIMNGLTPPKDLSCYLEKWFEVESCKDYIAIAPFTMWNKKNLSNDKWQTIINYIKKERGFNILQLGGPNEYQFENTFYPNSNIWSFPKWDYFKSVKKMLGCTFLLCLDGGLSWCASAYKFPVLGLYGVHYENMITQKVYEPINPNATYLEAQNAEDIPNELIFSEIDKMIDKYY